MGILEEGPFIRDSSLLPQRAGCSWSGQEQLVQRYRHITERDPQHWFQLGAGKASMNTHYG